MTRPNVRQFAMPPPPPLVEAASAPTPVDTSGEELKEAKAALIKLEQQKEAERELHNELKLSREHMQQMQQHMHHQALQAREEAARQQALYRQQMENMQHQFAQQMVHMQRQQQPQPPVHQASLHPAVVQEEKMIIVPPLLDSDSEESSEDESDREISIIGKANMLTQVPRRTTKIPPSALKLDL